MPKQIQDFENKLTSINPSANIVHSINGKGINENLWGLNALKEKSNYEEVLRWTTGLDANLSELKNLSGLAPAKLFQTRF